MQLSEPIKILGTAQLRSAYGIFESSFKGTDEEVGEFLSLARELGFSAFDTAPSYEGAEEALGKAVPGASIHTKLSPEMTAIDSITNSLQRLRRTQVDVAYLHDPLAPLRDGGRAIIEASRLTGEYFERLGTSVYSSDALKASLDNPEIKAIQIPVNPLWRQLLDELPQPDEDRPLIFGRSLLAQGLLVINSTNLPESVSHLKPYIDGFKSVCRQIERSPLECALLWGRSQKDLDGYIIGATTIHELQEISSSFDAPLLTPDERALIDAIPYPKSAIFDPRSWT